MLAEVRAAQDAFQSTLEEITKRHSDVPPPREEFFFDLAAGQAVETAIGAGWTLEEANQRIRDGWAAVENLRKVMGA